MSNPIVKALEHAAEKLGKTLGKDAGKAVEDLYHGTGHRMKKVATNHAENEAKQAAAFGRHFKNGEQDMPHAPHGTSGGGRPTDGGRSGGAHEEAKAGSPYDKTRREEGLCTDGTDPVDLATGRVFLSQTDILLPGALPLAFTRKYESSTRIGRYIGPSWSSTIDQRLEIDSDEVIFVTETGMLLRYAIPETGERVLPQHGPRWPLMRTLQGDWAVNDPETGQTRYFSDALHAPGLALPDEITDRNGNRITFDYAETGIPYGIRHSAGYELKLTCDEQGRLTALHLVGAADDGSDQLIRSYGHDEAGNLIGVTNSVGAVTQFEYDAEHRMTAWVDSNDFRYEYTYDHNHRCISQSGADGHMANRFSYDEDGAETGHCITVRIDGQGARTRYVVNDRLQVIAITDPLGNTTRTVYDATHDVPVRVSDPMGATTQLSYDEYGRLVTLVRPDGSTSTATYSDLGLPEEVTGFDGQTVRHEYDVNGNEVSVTDAAGRVSRFSYDDRGNISSMSDPLGGVTRMECDAAGLPLAITDPLGAITRITLDKFGRSTTITDPLGNTTHYQWSPEGNLESRVHPDGTGESWVYDGEGNCIAHTNPLGHVTSYEYGHFDQLKARTDPNGARHEFIHDTELRLVKVTNPQGLTWRYEYDLAGRLISETDFDNRTQGYMHDASGLLTCRTTPLGHEIRFQRDILGRTVTKSVDGEITTYSYDGGGRLVQITAPGSELTLTRDDLGQVVTETLNGHTTTFTYDALGRRTARTTPSGAVSRWTYDAASRRTDLELEGRSLNFVRDSLGRELSRRLGEITFTHAYDALGRLTGQHVTSALATVQRREFTYRADGNLTRVDDHLNGVRNFVLDDAGQVTSVSAHNWNETYAYDAAGNQTRAAWPDRHLDPEARGERTYAGTRVSKAGNIRYEYDSAGRTTLRQKTRLSRKPDTWHYTWNAEDRLTACTTPDGTTWHYTYDPLGRRTSKMRLTDDGERIAEQVIFTWDGTVLCEQTTLIFGKEKRVTLTWDHEGLKPLTQRERLTRLTDDEVDERFFAIVTDLVGAPTELVTETGDVAWRARSTVWGSTTWNREAIAYTPLRFPGQYFDAETNLHYNYFRHYDPDTARYVSPDPLGLSPAPNAVTYVHNPHTWADPLGLMGCKDGHIPEGHTSQPAFTTDPYHPDRVDNRIRETRELYGIKERPPGGMIGANGTQITSKTMWNHGPYRIDVENPNPGQRAGQLHFQDQRDLDAKYQYNFDTGKFDGLPRSVEKEVTKHKGFHAGISKGLRALGEG